LNEHHLAPAARHANVLTLQRTDQLARLKCVHPDEESATADARLLRNPGGGQSKELPA